LRKEYVVVLQICGPNLPLHLWCRLCGLLPA
jgi:hypothetical protein